MKIKLGKYPVWCGPYQIVEWFTPIFGEERIEKFQDGKVFEKFSDAILPLCEWIHNKQKRTVKIKLDRFDTWGAYHTLSLIIVPVLEQLRDTKKGSPFTDDEDVPTELRSTSALPTENEWDTDDLFHERWDWILNEMIWAFTEIRDEEWESQYHSGKHDNISVPIDKNGNVVPEEDAAAFRLDKGPNDTSSFDKEGYKKHAEKIQNGLMLFGKYYTGLWD